MKNTRDEYSLFKTFLIWICIFMFLFVCFMIQRCNNYVGNKYKDVNTFREWIKKHETIH